MSNLNIQESTELVIVGAGIAGLAVAKTLNEEGFKNYVLLEAQSVAGGRVQSMCQDSIHMELGAQFLHGYHSNLAGYCRKKNLLSDRQSGEGRGLFIRDDGVKIKQCFLQEISDVMRNSLAECEGYATNDMISHKDIEPNIGKLLRVRFSKYLKMRNYDEDVEKTLWDIFDWHIRFLIIDNACTKLDVLSVKKWGNFEITGGPEYNVFKEGYDSLVKSLLSDINIESLRLNSSVEKVSYDTNAAKCITTLVNGLKIQSKCVILTPSLGYLKKHQSHLFQPQLPCYLTNVINKLGFGLINKIFLVFESSWWKAGHKGFQLIWRQDILEKDSPAWIRDLSGFDIVEDEKAILLGWVGGEGAYLVEKINEDQIAEDCHQLLQKFLKKKDIPRIKRCIRTEWSSNKYILGSYSHITMNCDDANVAPEDLMKPVWSCKKDGGEVPLIMLAGEAASKQYYSTTHGAYDSGVHQAKVFLNHHDRENYSYF